MTFTVIDGYKEAKLNREPPITMIMMVSQVTIASIITATAACPVRVEFT